MQEKLLKFASFEDSDPLLDDFSFLELKFKAKKNRLRGS